MRTTDCGRQIFVNDQGDGTFLRAIPITVTAAVPEPSTWAMMLLGCFLALVSSPIVGATSLPLFDLATNLTVRERPPSGGLFGLSIGREEAANAGGLFQITCRSA